MQVFKLVQGGVVDKVIAFDELPKDLLTGIPMKEPAGFPRHWKKWLSEVGSKGVVVTTGDKGVIYRDEVTGFFTLDYITTNFHKERWQEIVSHVRRACDPSIRLLDKFEDMAKPLAPDAYSQLELEPEDVPVISLKKIVVVSDIKTSVRLEEKKEEKVKEELIESLTAKETVQAKKRGRPKKSEVVAT